MRKSEMQKVVDRILRAIHPFSVEKRRRILSIVENYIDDEFDVDEPADDEDDGDGDGE